MVGELTSEIQNKTRTVTGNFKIQGGEDVDVLLRFVTINIELYLGLYLNPENLGQVKQPDRKIEF